MFLNPFIYNFISFSLYLSLYVSLFLILYHKNHLTLFVKSVLMVSVIVWICCTNSFNLPANVGQRLFLDFAVKIMHELSHSE